MPLIPVKVKIKNIFFTIAMNKVKHLEITYKRVRLLYASHARKL